MLSTNDMGLRNIYNQLIVLIQINDDRCKCLRQIIAILHKKYDANKIITRLSQINQTASQRTRQCFSDSSEKFLISSLLPHIRKFLFWFFNKLQKHNEMTDHPQYHLVGIFTRYSCRSFPLLFGHESPLT